MAIRERIEQTLLAQAGSHTHPALGTPEGWIVEDARHDKHVALVRWRHDCERGRPPQSPPGAR